MFLIDSDTIFGGENTFRYKPLPFFSYCASSIEMLVPRGQLNDTRSASHVVFWNVRNVPDSNAVYTHKKGRNEKEKQQVLLSVFNTDRTMFADFCKCLFVKSYVRRLGLLLILFNDSTSYSFVILRLIIGINSK